MQNTKYKLDIVQQGTICRTTKYVQWWFVSPVEIS
jgi:hypothetical protein